MDGIHFTIHGKKLFTDIIVYEISFNTKQLYGLPVNEPKSPIENKQSLFLSCPSSFSQFVVK